MTFRARAHDAIVALKRAPAAPAVPIYYGDPIPSRMHRSCFLAGPSARPGAPAVPYETGDRPGWRPFALAYLRALGYRGYVILPEWRHGGDHDTNKGRLGWSGRDIVAWEHRGLCAASHILFWCPFELKAADDPSSMPGFTTRFEIGYWLARSPHKIVAGCNSRLATTAIKYHATRLGIKMHSMCGDTVEAVINRNGGRR